MSNIQVNNSVMTMLLTEIEKVVARSQKMPVIIAIDGNCGSGKTFYSSKLSTCLGASVIHCDDFFLPTELRSAERLNEVGGNIHYERLHDTLAMLKAEPFTANNTNQTFTYSAYNCSTATFEEITQAKSNIIIVEGSYALHKMLRNFYDLKILFKIDSLTQYQRLLQREGEQGISNFVNRWIPLENRYFDSLDTTGCVIVDTSEI